MDITQYLEQQWKQHGDSPQAVMNSLDTGLDLLSAQPTQEDKFRDFARLVEHAILGHVGDIAAYEKWVERLDVLPASEEDASVVKARLRYARDLTAGRSGAGAGLSDDMRFPSASNAVLGLSHSGREEDAKAILESIRSELRSATKSKAKVIANATNSVTFHLQQGPRHATANSLMVDAAIASRDAWERAGTWKEVERADYFIALACALAGRGEDALLYASRCRDICLDNGSEPYELFFAGEALVKAYVGLADTGRAADELAFMSRMLGDVASTQRKYCEAKLSETRALVDQLSSGPS